MLFAIEKIDKQLQEIKLAIHREIHDIPRFKFHEGECADAHRPDFDDRDWADFALGDAWGGYDVVAWFRTTVPIPAHLREQKLALRFLVGPRDSGNSTAESMLYVNGEPLQAIDRWHDEAWLPPELLQGDSIRIAIKAWSGVLDVPAHRHFRLAQLVQIDEPTERFYYLADTILRAAELLGENDLRRIEMLRVLDESLRRVEFVKHRPGEFYGSIEAAGAWLQQQIDQLRARDQIAPRVVAIGHSHIDLAWLWRLSHTREKAARTFTTVLHLLRQYPEYAYLHASPQLFKFLRKDYPDIYARVKAMVAAGRWEMTGGMWVEPDINIPSGESLIRQILFGKRFFRDEFGVENSVLWLPDVFGYSWSLPQIMRKSGLTYFLTTKISWNQFNRFPYDTFRWRGIDGSEVLTHFVTTPEEGAGSWHYTYNGQLTPFEIKGIWDNYRQKAINDELLHIYGWGDGGGGPTKEMLESGRAMRELPGLPRVELGKAEPYFARLAERLQDQDVPVWDGELYLEYHRGTYTSQAYNKRANRKAEILYHDAEWISSLADILTQRDEYPTHALRTGWELLLLNQFHDILPGSSIREVYEDSREQYAQIMEIGEAAVDRAQATLLDQIGTDGENVVVFNSLGWQRTGLIQVPYDSSLVGKTIHHDEQQASPVQIVEQDGEKKLLISVGVIPALGHRAFPLVDHEASAEAADSLIVQPGYLENRSYRITLNERGQIASLYDKENRRDVLAPNTAGNVLQAFQDKPMAFDAWDIDIYYQDKMQEISDLVEAAVEESGPLRGVLRLQWRFYDSTITQRLTIYAESRRIDFRTEADWHEQQVLLKVAFPVAVRSTKATYEIQFGSIERPTHWNTSWDQARFEVVGHKWVDLSEGNYGVALLNDCKYGHDVKDNILRLTLIKSPIRPDAQADQGRHVFTYSLLPHSGDWRDGDVAREAYDLNYPLRVALSPAGTRGSLPPQFSFAEPLADHVMIETIKRAEDDDAWIVRVFEFKQHRNAEAAINFGLPIARAVECNLLEEAGGAATFDGHRLTFGITPHEIKTFKVWFGAGTRSIG